MKIIKLDATDSTNAYLKNLLLSGEAEGAVALWAREQPKGRGQAGNTWISEAGKNLTFSYLHKNPAIEAAAQFSLNIAVSLALYEALSSLEIPELKLSS